MAPGKLPPLSGKSSSSSGAQSTWPFPRDTATVASCSPSSPRSGCPRYLRRRSAFGGSLCLGPLSPPPRRCPLTLSLGLGGLRGRGARGAGCRPALSGAGHQVAGGTEAGQGPEEAAQGLWGAGQHERGRASGTPPLTPLSLCSSDLGSLGSSGRHSPPCGQGRLATRSPWPRLVLLPLAQTGKLRLMGRDSPGPLHGEGSEGV